MKRLPLLLLLAGLCAAQPATPAPTVAQLEKVAQIVMSQRDEATKLAQNLQVQLEILKAENVSLQQQVAALNAKLTMPVVPPPPPIEEPKP